MMAQVEAREKKKHLKALGNLNAAEVLEVTIEEAMENGRVSPHYIRESAVLKTPLCSPKFIG